jgi:4-hydroxy 2-oxovalerate aldolase
VLHSNIDGKIIVATSNISYVSLKPDYVFNYQSLLENDAKIKDSAVIMLMKLLYKLNIKNINIAGFDGFSGEKENYYIKGKSLNYKIDNQTSGNLDALNHLPNDLNVNFITHSLYKI